MPDRKPANKPLILLIIVLVLLVLIVSLQYAFKHNLLPVPAIRPSAPALSGTDGDFPGDTRPTEPEGAAATPVPTPGPELDAAYYAYLADTLIPAYGLADESAVADAYAARYRFAPETAPAGSEGIVSAAITDTDGDFWTEMVVLLIRAQDDAFVLELRVYAMQEGRVVEPAPDSAAVVAVLSDEKTAASDNSVEIVAADGRAYVLLHEYFEETGVVCDRYAAYDITGGLIAPVMRGAFTLYDNPVLVLAEIPPWLDEKLLKDAPDAEDAASGLSGKLLYSGGVQRYAFMDELLNYPVYETLYPSAIDATAAMLGPLSGTERIKLLEPLSLDWTGFRFALVADE